MYVEGICRGGRSHDMKLRRAALESLHEIGARNGTDKAGKRKDVCRRYEPFIRDRRLVHPVQDPQTRGAAGRRS